MPEQGCPICRDTLAQRREPPNQDALIVTCETCGQFVISGILARSFASIPWSPKDEKLRPYLSAYTRQASDRGEHVVLEVDNWRDFARSHAGTSIQVRLRKTLEMLAKQSKEIGARVILRYERAYPLVDAKSQDELDTFLRYLESEGLVKSTGEPQTWRVTIPGLQSLEPAGGAGIPGRCFVAMSFHESLDDAWQLGIKLAVEADCKCEAVRIDLVEHNEKICDRILAEARKAQFVVADCSKHRQNVYFEAGFAMGLGRPVIWTCRKEDFEEAKTHFDTRQYNHIVWETPAELRQKLRDRIEATVLK